LAPIELGNMGLRLVGQRWDFLFLALLVFLLFNRLAGLGFDWFLLVCHTGPIYGEGLDIPLIGIAIIYD